MKKHKIRQYISLLYVILIILVMPFYFEDGYFNLTFAKVRFLWVTGGILLFAAFLSYIFEKIYYKVTDFHTADVVENCKSFSAKIKDIKFSILDIAMVLFLCSVVFSGLVSKTPKEAFWGSRGWYMGIFTIAILVSMYFVVSRNFEYHKYLGIIIVVSSVILYVMGILNSFHVDVFGLHQRITNDFYDYISTIGNVNWYVGYLSMIVPMGCIAFLGMKKLPARLLMLIFIDLGFYNVIICRSNGIILGLAAAFFIITLYVILQGELWKDYLILILNFGIVLGIVSFIYKFYTGAYVKIDNIFMYIVENHLWIICGGVLLILAIPFCAKKTRKNLEENHVLSNKLESNKKNRTYSAFIFSIFSAMTGLSVLLYQISIFSEKWGTKRGALWIYTCELFAEFPWTYKLFGCGCDCFGVEFISENYNYLHQRYLNAHNEFLQYLITTGIFGLISFSLIWIAVGIMFIYKKSKSRTDWILFTGIMGYLGQSIVNNPQAYNYAVLFLLLAFFGKSYRENV